MSAKHALPTFIFYTFPNDKYNLTLSYVYLITYLGKAGWLTCESTEINLAWRKTVTHLENGFSSVALNIFAVDNDLNDSIPDLLGDVVAGETN